MMQASIDEDHKLEVGDKLNLVEMALTHPFSETMNQIEHDRIFSLKIPIVMTLDAIQQRVPVFYPSFVAPTF